MRRLALAGLALLAGCAPSEPERPEPDPALVDALVELHLADAVAALDSTASDTFADSLRDAALAAHGLDSAALAARLDALADDPGMVQVTYEALGERILAEREGRTEE
ncbi:DUF4296 domain-containing protein [Rubrivirga sp. IMCC45206]|uniref:DUF4296 domain-containing protein n=1 Tax=Rubrivirga sp. IMCC45206 TaxID=3391614 RepID=UPI00398FA92B